MHPVFTCNLVRQGDANEFKRFSLSFMVPLPWDNAQDEQNMLTKLRTGEVCVTKALEEICFGDVERIDFVSWHSRMC